MVQRVLLIAVVASFISYTVLKSQEIDAHVSVNMEQITPENRVSVNNFAHDIERYLNGQRFTGADWDGPKITVDLSVALTGGANNKYSAQVFIASKRDIAGTEDGKSIALRLLDKNWSFEYNMGANPSYNPQVYDKLTTLLDFYMLTIIGFDLDTYNELDGNKIYNQAKLVASMASSSNDDGWETISQPGEFTKYTLINELTNPQFEDFRNLITSYYSDGLDLMASNKAAALDNLAYIIQEMADFKRNKLTQQSVIMQAFFEAKAYELADVFKGYTKHPGVFQNLIYLDPSSTPIYQEASGE